jgi:Actin like proteins N terminal domain
MNNLKLVTIDIGNSVFKVGADNELKQFNSMIKEIDINTMDFSEAIVFNDKCCAISQGDYIHDNFKATKSGLEQFILYAISTITEEVEVNLMLNLPVNQIANKELLKDRLQGKEFEFTVNSPLNGLNKEAKIVKINKVGVVGESIACYYSLDDDSLTEFIVIFDIGSKTINFATFTSIGVLDLDKSGTLDFGVHYLYENVIEYYKTEEHKTYTIADIDARVKANKIKIPKEIKENFVDKIKNGLKSKGFYDFDDYSIKVCGGGAIILGNELNSALKDVEVLSNPLFRNNLGSQIIAEGLGF